MDSQNKVMNTESYCWTCQKPLTGELPATEHYASASHRKKIELEANICKNTATGNFYCSMCKILCNSHKTYQEHSISERHREIERRYKEAILLQEKSDQLTDQPGEFYSFKQATGRGFCKICQIELTSLSHAHQHLNGEKHKKKEVQCSSVRDEVPCTSSNIVPVDEIKSLLSHKVSTPKGPTYNAENFDEETNYCRICDVSLRGQLNVRHHFDSDEHFRNKLQPEINMNKISRQLYQASLKLPQVDIKTPVEMGTSGTDEYTFNGSAGFCHICKIQLTSPQHAEQHLSGAKHCKASNLRSCNLNIVNSSDQRNEGRDESYSFINGRGRCYVCNIELTSPMHANQHLSGQKHQKAKARSNDSDQAYPLTCDVCTVSFTGQESAKQHFISPKHVKKMKIKMAMNGSIFGNVGDMTTWSYCDTCECPVNSAAQLKIHKQSPKHLAQLKKRENYSFCNSERSSSSSRDEDIDLGFKLDRQTLQQKEEEIDCEYKQKILQLKQEADLKKKLLHVNSKNIAPINQQSVKEEAFFRNTGNNCISRGFDLLGASSTQEVAGLNDPRSIPVVSRSWKTAKVDTDHQHTEEIQRENLGTEAETDCSLEDENFPDLDKEDIFEMKKTKSRKYQPLKNKNFNHTKESIDLTEDLSSLTIAEEKNTEDNFEESLSDYASFASSSDNHSISSSGASNNILRDISDLRSVFLPKRLPVNPNTIKGVHKFYCNLCQKSMNTEKSLLDHRAGQLHKQKVLTMKAPPFQYPSVIKNDNPEKIKERAPFLTKRSKPRSYQIELFLKSVQSDSVCFLPTGTGKTLIGVMTMSFMLELNPTRPVLFLVDKTLLVMQQAKYIYKELAEKIYQRPKAVEEVVFEMEKRKLHIAVLCGGLQKTDSIPLWRHDVIITTAAFCENLLHQEIINWSDFSLIIFDEVHHCVKRHPYCTLMAYFHKQREMINSPKILGLTASPAGKNTLKETELMLNELLQNLGGARMAIVEGKNDLLELDKYKSNAKLLIHCEPRTSKEAIFMQLLQMHVVDCYDKLCELTDLNEKKIAGFADLKGRSVEERAKKLDDDTIEMFTYVLDSLSPLKKSDILILDLLRVYTKHILQALSDMETGSIAFAISNLDYCEKNQKGINFKFAEELGLNNHQLKKAVDEWRNLLIIGKSTMHMTSFRKLLLTLTEKETIDWTKEKSMALILVQKRSVAKRLSSFLKDTKEIKDLKLRVTHLVGHGVSGADDGMKVNKQKQIMNKIKENYFHIVVATSIAEEGVDIPECQLVICLNPPSNVTALVQMRGRARKKDSLFVVICSTAEQEEKINNLIEREKNMEIAAQIIVQNERMLWGKCGN